MALSESRDDTSKYSLELIRSLSTVPQCQQPPPDLCQALDTDLLATLRRDSPCAIHGKLYLQQRKAIGQARGSSPPDGSAPQGCKGKAVSHSSSAVNLQGRAHFMAGQLPQVARLHGQVAHSGNLKNMVTSEPQRFVDSDGQPTPFLKKVIPCFNIIPAL